jgi:RHS repeat-associated protein
MQYNGNHKADKYFYLHDRLGSVRQIVDKDGLVVKYYTFGPFGDTRESGGSLDDPFMFTGQWFDSEIGQYYLRARQYDPIVMRFTTRDPVFGQFEEPMSLHKYLYCRNNSINAVDPTGLWDNGLRYILEHEYGVANPYALSDEDIKKRFPTLWNNTSYPNWHGHSDLGYLSGDFDYTSLDNRIGTQPNGLLSYLLWPIGGGTDLHFRPLEGANGSELEVGLAILSGDSGRFQDAMHMGQDYFSHVGKGYDPYSHAATALVEGGRGGHLPDYPYATYRNRVLDSAYLGANEWTKKWEDQWYLVWDTDKWLELP